jgi:peptidoglycan/xylan/chitin deacetylase (PgdA/CDA1 family)
MRDTHYVNLQSVAETWTEGALILMYHMVEAPPLFHGMRGLYVSPQHLGRQLRELQSSANASFTNLSEWNSTRPDARQVIITFDDAYLSLFKKGLPVLQATGLRAINYVVADRIGQMNQWDHSAKSRDEKLMDRSQINEWLAAGHEIGAHTLTHPHLERIPLELARREIVDSKKKLEDQFGIPIRHFCYPYGGHNQAVRDLVEEAGYETGTSTIEGFNTKTTDTYLLRRHMARHEKPWLAALMRR